MEQVETGHAQRHAGGSRENRRGNNRVRYTEKVFVPKNRNQNHQASSTSDPFASNASSSSSFDNPLDHVPLPPPHVIDPSIRAELQTGNSQQASRRNETGRAHRGPRRGGHAQQERAVDDAGASHDFGEAPRRGRRDGQRNQRNRGRRDSPSHVDDEVQPAHERDAIGSGDAGASGPVPRGDARGGERRTEAPRRNGGNDRQDRSQRGERRTDRGQQRGGRRDKRDQPRHHDSYAHAHARVAPTTAAHGEMTDLAEELLTGLLNDSYECMICMNNIRRRQSIWHCEECYALFHLDCISKWSKNSLEEARQVPQGILPQKPPADGWRCPHCNKTHREREGPPVSRCFCGKYTNPEFNPYVTPHSCGDLCGRMRAGTDCPHPCNLPCHPGPCPPCSATGPVKYCWCGNEEYRTRCGETDPGRSCGELCDRPLNCRKHRCEEPCHPGSCQKCTKQLPMKCYCGKVEEERTCGTEVEDKASGETRHFSCGAVCGQKLACGNHTCQRVCHTGPCDECALLPKNVKKCACGKTDILFLAAPRTSCLDPIPTCTKKCEKKLHCGVHSCAKNCHVGDCPPCKGTVDMPCRCKLNTKRIPCLQAFPLKTKDSSDGDKAPVVVLCDVACSITRSCGRHRCNTKCCTSAGDPLADEHICKIPCNKPLKCGKHRCGRLCHKGRCPPCLEASFDELACHCGKTVMAPPIPCSTLPPECNHPCVRPSPCGHALPYHACHRDNEPCPPCTVLVEKWCMGNHELRSHVPCHVKDVSCGSPCGKPMPCGQHKCARICHRAPCVVPKEPETAATSSAKNKTKKDKKDKEKDEPAWEETDEKQSDAEPELISCGQKCGRPLKHCAHNCLALCHPGQPCPVAQCRQMVRITCPCRRRSMEVLCLRGGAAAEDEPGKEKEEDDFDPSQREDKRQLSCDEMCEREKRNQRIDEAFNMTGTKEKEAPVFTEELLAAARGNTVKFVQKVEEEFKKLILSPSGIRHSFPPMKVLQRALIHELARWYRLDAISYDPEPLRNVVVMKKGDSRIPPYALLSTLMASGRLPKVATTAPALGSAFDMDIGDATDCVLQIYNLSPIITTEHLATFLSRFSGEYVLKWLDDANALAIFSNVQQYQAALSSLQTDGTFKIRPYEGPKTSWLRSRTMVKGESASSSSTSSSSSSSATVATKPAKKPTTDAAAAAAKPGLPPPASFAAPNAFAVLLSSPAVDGVAPDDVSKDDSAAAPADWEELADDGATSTDHAPPPVASTTTPTTTASTQASTPNVWNAVVASHVEPEKAPTAESRGEHTAATSAQWPCAHCTFLNPPSASRCEVCENTRF